jgi:hypothetical protein
MRASSAVAWGTPDQASGGEGGFWTLQEYLTGIGAPSAKAMLVSDNVAVPRDVGVGLVPARVEVSVAGRLVPGPLTTGLEQADRAATATSATSRGVCVELGVTQPPGATM